MQLLVEGTDELLRWRLLHLLRGFLFLFGYYLLSGCGGIASGASRRCQWVFLRDILIYGGNRNEVVTFSECQNLCMATNNCFRIDWAASNPPGSRCIVRTKDEWKFSAEGVFNYYSRYCTDCQWIRYPYMRIPGGEQHWAPSLETCQFACQLSTGCQSIGWSPTNRPGTQCFLQMTQSGKIQTSDYFVHFDAFCNTVERGGVCSWTFSNNTIIIYGRDNAALTWRDCQLGCQSTPTCVIADWVQTNGKCYLHASQDQRSQVTTIDVEHYQPNGDCRGSCTWTKFETTDIRGGLKYPAPTPADCQSACVRLVGCQGIDWEDNQTYEVQCYLLASQDKKGPIWHTTHFDLNCQPID